MVRGVPSPRGALGPVPQQYTGVGNLVLAWSMLVFLAMVFGMPAVAWLWERFLL